MHFLIDVRGLSPFWMVPLPGLGCNSKEKQTTNQADQAKRSNIPLQLVGFCPDFYYKLYEVRPFFPRLISVMLFYHIPEITAPRRQRQEDYCKFYISLVCGVIFLSLLPWADKI